MKILGVNKRTYPSVYLQEDAAFFGADRNAIEKAATMYATVTVVLVEGDVGDYAAYAGFGGPEWVARFGDKIGFEEACVHFPKGQLQRQLQRERYRE